jgi:hypothetical protein
MEPFQTWVELDAVVLSPEFSVPFQRVEFQRSESGEELIIGARRSGYEAARTKNVAAAGPH